MHFLKKKGVAVVLILAGLSGCAQMQQQRQQAARQQMIAEMQQRCAEAFANPAIDPVRGKITSGVRDITLAMRTNSDHVSPDEKPALEAFMSARKVCDQAEVQFFQQPQIAASYQGVLQRTDELIAKLYAGRITYGEFNSSRIENVVNGGKEIAAIRQNLAAQHSQQMQVTEPQPQSAPQEADNAPGFWQRLAHAVGQAALETANDIDAGKYQPRPVTYCAQFGQFGTVCN